MLLPCPKQFEAEASPRPLSLVPSPAHTRGACSTLRGGVPPGLLPTTEPTAIGHFAVLGLRGRRCLPRPELEGFRPDAVDAPWLPESALYPQRPSKAPIRNMMAGPHPTLTHFLSQSVCAGRLTTAG